MGQAKLRGSNIQRIEQAKARLEASKPQFITCNHCQAKITEISVLDSRGMQGITAAFVGMCACTHNTLALQGTAEACAAAATAWQNEIGADGLLGLQPVTRRG